MYYDVFAKVDRLLKDGLGGIPFASIIEVEVEFAPSKR
jgi:hypothetical protein